jgi:hypothetical protein
MDAFQWARSWSMRRASHEEVLIEAGGREDKARQDVLLLRS